MTDKLNGCIFWCILLEKYNTIWDKFSADIKKEFDFETVYDKVFLKTKIKLMVIKLQIFTIKIAKIDSNHSCLAVFSLDFALKKDKKLLSLSVFKRM